MISYSTERKLRLWAKIIASISIIYLVGVFYTLDRKWPKHIWWRVEKEAVIIQKPVLLKKVSDSLKKSNDSLQKKVHRLKSIPPKTVTIIKRVKGDCIVVPAKVVVSKKRKHHRKHFLRRPNGRGVYDARNYSAPSCSCPRN
jgi:hypothetical protein